MSEHMPDRPGAGEDIPAGSAHSADEDFDLPGERLDDDFDVATAREQVWEERHHRAADPSGSLYGDPGVIDGS